jgi:RNA polymerase sigma factor (sigma-70 family)
MNFWPRHKPTPQIPPVAVSEVKLAQAACKGDKKAFVELVARHQAMVCGITLGILNNFAASEDAAQDAFLTAWKKIKDLRDPAALKPWLAQVARNSALTHLRRQRGHDPLDETIDLPDESPSPSDVASSEEEAELVRTYLARLPENYRLPLVLYYREGQSVRAVAESLEISEDAVKQRLSRGREMMKEKMSGLLENVLTQTRPTAIFTIAIAVAIGAMAAPAAVAGAVFTAASTTAASATTADLSARLVTLMSTSKNIIIVSAFVTAACIPVGYSYSNYSNYRGDGSAPTKREVELLKTPTNTTPSYEKSQLFAEWRHLHEIHGSNASAMPLLYDAISKLTDPSRRRIFRGALIAEWAQLDGAGGFAFFSGKNGDDTQRTHFLREWLANSPLEAVNALISGGKTWDNSGREILSDIARTVPDKLGELVEKLPKSDSYWDTSVRDAFSQMTLGSLQNAKLAAEKLTGVNRNEALAGVAKAWGKSDLKQAILWAKSLPSTTDQNEIIRSALIGRAGTEPVSALEESGIVPAGGRSGYFASTTGARILSEAAKSDFETTVSWLAAHPGRFNHDDLQGLANVVTERLNGDPGLFLSARVTDGSLASLLPAIGSALLNDGSHQQTAIWEWLKTQPETEATKSLKSSVLNAASYKDPGLALRMSRDIPATPAGDLEVSALARGLLNGGSMLGRLDNLLLDAPPRVRQELLNNAFDVLQQDSMNDPKTWAARLQLLPLERQASGAQALARSWAVQDPENTIAWANSLKGDSRMPALTTAASTWAANDPAGAARWVSSLNDGLEKDAFTATLVVSISDRHPSEAWEWAVTIQDPTIRGQAANRAALSFAKQNPVAARQSIEGSNLPPEMKSQLINSISGTIRKVSK